MRKCATWRELRPARCNGHTGQRPRTSPQPMAGIQAGWSGAWAGTSSTGTGLRRSTSAVTLW